MSKIYNNNPYQQSLTITPPATTKYIVLKADSGASKTYIPPVDIDILRQRVKIYDGPSVAIPNGNQMKTIESGVLPLHSLLSLKAKNAHVLEGLSNASLLSVGQICDDKCITVFDKRYLNIYKHGMMIILGKRN